MAAKKSDARSAKPPSLWQYSSMGLELAGAIVGLTLLGYWADRHFGTTPRWLLVGAGLGIVGGFYNFIREALELSRRQEATQRRRRNRDSGVGEASEESEREDGRD